MWVEIFISFIVISSIHQPHNLCPLNETRQGRGAVNRITCCSLPSRTRNFRRRCRAKRFSGQMTMPIVFSACPSRKFTNKTNFEADIFEGNASLKYFCLQTEFSMFFQVQSHVLPNLSFAAENITKN